MDAVLWFDHAVISLFGRIANSSPAIDRLIFHSASSDLIKGGVIIALAWWVWFDTAADAWPRRAGVVKAIVAAIAGAAVSQVMQNFMPHRPRPMHGSPGFVAPAGIEPSTIDWLRDWSSFPSDHATLFFGLAFGLWLVDRRVGTIALIWAFMVASLPRIYLGLHYPSDIVAGALLGMAVAALVFAAPIPSKDGLHKIVEARPALFYSVAFLLCFELGQLFQNVRTLGGQLFKAARALLMGP